jgi:hypothetical protein
VVRVVWVRCEEGRAVASCREAKAARGTACAWSRKDLAHVLGARVDGSAETGASVRQGLGIGRLEAIA